MDLKEILGAFEERKVSCPYRELSYDSFVVHPEA